MLIGNLEVYGIIYKITNMVNGKIYIGQTTIGFKNRYANGGGTLIDRVYRHHNYRENKNFDYNKHLLSSIKKYGLISFEVKEYFDIAFSKDELDIKECTYIKLYNCLNKKYGYNHKEGGGHGKLPESITDLMGKPVVQLSLNGEFIKEWATMSKAQRLLNMTNVSFSDKNNISNSYGFIWMLKDNYDINYSYQYRSPRNGNYILLNENGDIEKEYTSKDDIENDFKMSSGYINMCINGKNLLKNKYNLMTKEQYNTGEFSLLTSSKGKYIGENNHNFGRKATKEIKAKQSASHVGIQKGKDHPMYGKHHSEESLRKMRESKKGQSKGGDNGFATIYEVYDINWNLIKVFASQIQTVEWMVEKGFIGTKKSGKSTICRICTTPQKPYKGLYFKRFKKNTYNKIIQ